MKPTNLKTAIESGEIPAAACRISAPHAVEIEFGDNGEQSKTTPFRMVARTGSPIEHWFWGNVVHDLAGMKMAKSRVPIDYAHDDGEVIGFGNHIETESGDLVVSGALTPFGDNDRAAEVIYKQRAGVPYEASINFGGDGIKVEQLDTGETTNVNGREFSGPGIVIREWPLRGVAVCPYGADSGTSTTFNNPETCKVEIMPTKLTEAVEADQAVETTTETDSVEAAEVKTTDAAVETQPDAEAELDSVAELSTTDSVDMARQECARYIAVFGANGGQWFAEGKTFAECRELQLADLQAENEQLRQKLSAASAIAGEDGPVEFQPEAKDKPKKVIRFSDER